MHHSSFRSARLGDERPLWVYTPPGYDPAHDRYPLLVAFDGGNCVLQMPVHRMLDNLIADGRIAPTMALLVGNASAT